MQVLILVSIQERKEVVSKDACGVCVKVAAMCRVQGFGGEV